MGRSQRRPRKQKIKDGGQGGDDLDKSVIHFFEALLTQKGGENNTSISADTRLFFKTFFDAFNNTKVDINKDDITEKNYKAGVFDHMNKEIKKYVDETMVKTYTYNTFIGRKVKMEISFHEEQSKDIVAKYISMMVFWLQIVAKIATVPCEETLQITLFLSKLKKILLGTTCSTKSCVIDKSLINTGYSTRCSEIVIFREEEWFKVFVHETIHNFGLDFSWDKHYYNDKIKSIFNIKIKDVKLYEAYTEALAKIINVLLLTYDTEKTNFETFVALANKNILLERANGYFQSNKILNYKQLYMDNLTTYEENTASFSYYIIVAILYSDYQDFLSWCIKNNTNYIQFNLSNSKEKQHSFCDFIESKARGTTFQKNIKLYRERFFTKTEPSTDYLYTYMKKSILTRSLVA